MSFRISILLFLVLHSLAVQAQKTYFIYIESENRIPFYIKTNDTAIYSGDKGYVIIPSLMNKEYKLILGRSNHQNKEYTFSIHINSKDHGYLFRESGNHEAALVNLQTNEIILPGKADADSLKMHENIDLAKHSPFALALAQATGDPDLLNSSIPDNFKKEENEPVTQIRQSKDTAIAEKTEDTGYSEDSVQKASMEIMTEKINPATDTKSEMYDKKKDTGIQITLMQSEPTEEVPAVKTKEKPEWHKKSTIRKKSESSTTEGFGLTFLEEYEDGTADTIKILIPHPAHSLFRKLENQETAAADTFMLMQKKQTNEITKGFGRHSGSHPDCKNYADKNDLTRLKKQLQSKTDEFEMVNAARKVFKNKCFSVMQIKELSELFQTESGKYQFFDMAYSFVADRENFEQLISAFQDEYYINRFKAMIRQ
ncbi:MAG: DUF4476 domain-containing protein [Chitinophagaceae bacterium]|nr:DUF4476 domain-containing protein [Chitinophagaceae bacterium]